MSEPTDAWEVHLLYLRERMDEVVAHLRTQNGKIETHSNRLAVLEDRGTEARATGAKWGATAGAFVTGAAIAIWQFFLGNK